MKSKHFARLSAVLLGFALGQLVIGNPVAAGLAAIFALISYLFALELA